MAAPSQIERILGLYPDDCTPRSVDPVASPTSFSGAGLWRIGTPRGTLCLRRWPSEHPSQDRLEFIQAVLWHVDQEGFRRVPLPLETRHHHGYVRHDGHLWELTPWLPGQPDYRRFPSPVRLGCALTTLAQFHQAARSFPLPEPGPAASPGMVERRDQLRALLAGGNSELEAAVSSPAWPELAPRARGLLSAFGLLAPRVLADVDAAATLRVALQPCIRDVWHAHVLFKGDEVTGLVDFGAMRPDTVAADVARLLGSLAGDDPADWRAGLAAYQDARPLTADELALVRVFDRSTVLLGGIQWLRWIYLEGREFANPRAVLTRIDEIRARLEVLARAAD